MFVYAVKERNKTGIWQNWNWQLRLFKKKKGKSESAKRIAFVASLVATCRSVQQCSSLMCCYLFFEQQWHYITQTDKLKSGAGFIDATVIYIENHHHHLLVNGSDLHWAETENFSEQGVHSWLVKLRHSLIGEHKCERHPNTIIPRRPLCVSVHVSVFVCVFESCHTQNAECHVVTF